MKTGVDRKPFYFMAINLKPLWLYFLKQTCVLFLSLAVAARALPANFPLLHRFHLTSCLSQAHCHKSIFSIFLSWMISFESQALCLSDAHLSIFVFIPGFGWQLVYPGVVLEVPSCEATNPGMTHNSVLLSSCQSRLTEASAGHTMRRVAKCPMASVQCERPCDSCVCGLYVWHIQDVECVTQRGSVASWLREVCVSGPAVHYACEVPYWCVTRDREKLPGHSQHEQFTLISFHSREVVSPSRGRINTKLHSLKQFTASCQLLYIVLNQNEH